MKKKISLVIIGFIIMIFALATNSNAEYINSFSSVAYNTNYYCLNHAAHNINASTLYYNRGTYTIKGNEIARGRTTEGQQTKYNWWNGVLARVLYAPRGVATPQNVGTAASPYWITGVRDLPQQQALWGVARSWANAVGYSVGASANYSGAWGSAGNGLINTAKAYANEVASYGVTNNTNFDAITVEAFDSNGETLVRVGPFNLTFGGDFKSFTLTGNDGINIPIRSYESYSGSTLQTISAPVSGQNFYVTFSVPEGVHSIEKIGLTSRAEVINVTFTVYSSSNGQQDVLVKEEPHYESEDYYGEWECFIDLFGKIDITKVDETTLKAMPDVGFTLQMVSGVKAGQYVSIDANGNAVYSDTPTTLITDENGNIHIEQMWMGDYELVEVVNPHYGYFIDGELPKVIGTYTVNPGATAEVTATNLRRWIRLSGIVWEDMIDGKTSTRNGLYSDSDGDKRVANVVVKLLDKDGNPVTFNNSDGEPLTEILTDENGYYQMWDIEIEKLPEYYIQFTYNGMSYEPVPLVDLSPTNEFSSKAAENADERTEFNRKYSEITHSGSTGPVGESRDDSGSKTYDLNYDTDQYYEDNDGNIIGQNKSTLNYGPNSKDADAYGYDGQKFPVNPHKIDEQYIMHASTKDAYQSQGQSGYLTDFASIDQIRQNWQEEIQYINLGIQEREQPDLALIEDIDNVKVSLNGYEHTYNYNDRFQALDDKGNPEGFNVGVKFGNEYGTAEYTQTIYSSDVVYNGQNAGSLGVSVRYKIALRNESTNLYTVVNDVINYYDSRYTIGSITDDAGNTYNYSNDGSVGEFNKITITDVNKQLAPQSVDYIYITYVLNNDAINAVLNNDQEYINNPLDSISEIASYSTYSDSGFSVHYAGVDKDSRPGSATPGDRTTYEDDTDGAPAFKLEVQEGRVIAGNIWEDDALADLLNIENTEENIANGTYKERLGDGVYDQSSEGLINGVDVELIVLSNDANSDIDLSSVDLSDELNGTEYTTASLYQRGSSTPVPAKMTTGENGSANGYYEFSGVIPGKYLLKFTYGNKSVIVRTDGSTEEIGDVDKYKSTIYRGGSANNIGDDYWYRKETSGAGAQRWSDARDEIGINANNGKYDIIDDRLHNPDYEYYYGNTTDDTTVRDPNTILSAIESRTRGFEIMMDYDVVTDSDAMSENGDELRFVFDNMDFGIIRRPIQRLTVQKQVSYVKVTLANGQVLIEGDPRTDNLQYVRFLPNGDIHIEIDNEIMQGATLTIGYELIADNTASEVDYNDESYYFYGEPSDPSTLVAPRIKRLNDYLSNDLVFDGENSPDSWHQYTAEEVEELLSTNHVSQDVYDIIKGYNQLLWTDAFKDIGLGRFTTNLQVSKILSTSADNLTFGNDIEVNILTGRRTTKDGSDDEYTIPGDYIPSEDGRTDGGDNDYRLVTVTGPTGEDFNYIPYIILGFGVLIILGVGIIFIKKKAL